MASPPHGTTLRTTIAALVAGLVLLALVVGFAVGLPEVEAGSGETSGGADLATLPSSLPGGFVDVEEIGGPEGGDAAAIAYVNSVLAQVYPDEDTAFRAYIAQDREALLTVTAFAAPGGAFAPANGVADAEQLGLDRAPTELTRVGDAVCVASYQSAAPGASAPDAEPLSVNCQEPHEGTTVQVGAQGIGIEETVELLGRLVDSLA